ncbi:MAG TPA: potassium channel family protein [Micromonosporaceae bacterium]|nr:potassium channel family protein [Micromonosporaceae bacterium]
MAQGQAKSPADLSRRHRRWLFVAATLRGLGTTVLLVTIYYLAPLDGALDSTPFVLLIISLLLLIGLIVWQVRAIVDAPFPKIRAVESLFSTLPLLLLSFAATYYLMARSVPHDFSEAMTRTDALYFTVTVFATVGFGDITAVTQSARIVVTVQMLIDLAVLGVGLRIFLSAAERGAQKRAQE